MHTLTSPAWQSKPRRASPHSRVSKRILSISAGGKFSIPSKSLTTLRLIPNFAAKAAGDLNCPVPRILSNINAFAMRIARVVGA